MALSLGEINVLESKVYKILPSPFGWCFIPSGKVFISETGLPPGNSLMLVKNDFLIAKYPITNAQYRCFIHDGGYEEEKYWFSSGWNIKKREGWSGSSEINNTRVNFDTGPVVGVSWFEAHAFTKWLSEKTNLTCGLPTESQWQLAAQGTDARLFPWGNEFDPANANTPLNPDVATTPVNTYEHAPSPYGVIDMVGNASEWTITGWINGDENLFEDLSDESQDEFEAMRMIRGGAWDLSKDYSNNLYRVNCHPRLRLETLGFRIVLQINHV